LPRVVGFNQQSIEDSKEMSELFWSGELFRMFNRANQDDYEGLSF